MTMPPLTAPPPVNTLQPVATLRQRVRDELSGLPGEAAPDLFDRARPLRIGCAPGRLDVMGGIAHDTGALVCQATLDRATAVALQERTDSGMARQLRIVALDLLDQHRPFTFGMSLNAIAAASADQLRREFTHPERRWAGYIAGCLFVLHEARLIDLADPRHRGLNLAVHSTVPMGAGVGSSAALEAASMMVLLDHFELRPSLDIMRLAELCNSVDDRILAAPTGIVAQITSLGGQRDALLRLLCQPHALQSALQLPTGIRCIGIHSGVQHDLARAARARIRCAGFMGHRIILHLMRQLGEQAGHQLTADPMQGYLANLLPEDYKQIFRSGLPEQISGRAFVDTYGPALVGMKDIEPDVTYFVQQATDHHVLEAMRCRNFSAFCEQAANDPTHRSLLLNKAGHLMYASHISYSNNAGLGAAECDLLVDLIRQRESDGFYGARISGGGMGGTVAVLANIGTRTEDALGEIAAAYTRQTGHTTELFATGESGAWALGTALV